MNRTRTSRLAQLARNSRRIPFQCQRECDGWRRRHRACSNTRPSREEASVLIWPRWRLRHGSVVGGKQAGKADCPARDALEASPATRRITAGCREFPAGAGPLLLFCSSSCDLQFAFTKQRRNTGTVITEILRGLEEAYSSSTEKKRRSSSSISAGSATVRTTSS